MEKRRSSRRLLRREVGLESSRGGAHTAHTRDMSLGGMFVETDPQNLPPNASVTVSFTLPNGKQNVFVLEAAVVRRAPNGLGLMFLRMAPDAIRDLSEALAAHHDELAEAS